MRDHHHPTPDALAGSLLIAHPTLREENFRRTVILISSHDENGAMGVILNRSLDKRLGQLNAEFALNPLADIPLFHGGPVERERILLCAWQFHPDGSGFQLFFGIDPEKAIELKANENMHLRAFLGYAGWSAGQLEKELKQDTWVLHSLYPNTLDLKPDQTLWRALLSNLGDDWRIMAGEPDDLTGN